MNSIRKITAIIQARMGSTRLPGKVLLDLEGKPVLVRVVERVLKSKKINNIIIATTDKKEDEAIVDLVKSYNHPKVTVFRGSELDVRDRYFKAAKEHAVDIIVRITSDCPVIDPTIIDKVIDEFLASNADYAANIIGQRTYPRGLDTEVFSFDVLKNMYDTIDDADDKEHVTFYIRRQPHLFKTQSVTHSKDYSHHRWTLDEKDDYEFLKAIYKNVYHQNQDFGMEEVVTFLEQNPAVMKLNEQVRQKHP